MAMILFFAGLGALVFQSAVCWFLGGEAKRGAVEVTIGYFLAAIAAKYLGF